MRTKLTAVVLVPLVLAGVLGALRLTDLVGEANDSTALARQIEFARQLGAVVRDLQTERYRVVTIQAGDRGGDPEELRKQRQRVDSSVASVRAAETGANAFPAAARDQWGPAHQAVLSRLSGLDTLRRAARPPAVPGEASSRAALVAYSELIAALLDLHRQALSGAPEALARQADGIKALAVAQEEASWQHAVLQTGILTDGLSTEQQAGLRTAQARFEAAAAEFGQASVPARGPSYFAARAVAERERLLDAALDQAVRGAPLENVPGTWNAAASATVDGIWQGQTTLLGELRDDAGLRGDQALRQALWDGSIIGVLLLLAVALLIVVVRSLLRPLRALRTAAFEVADRRLPEAVGQLRGADGAPGQTTVDPVPVHSREELGQVARAVDTVHAQALRLAAEQAQLRTCLNDVFLRLSGRGHALLEQQLGLLLDSRADAEDPALRGRLEALTGLATRMRRHSENLLAIAGGTARRVEGTPVPVADAFGAAVTEIEEGARVIVYPPPAVTVRPSVVTDLVHLVAELLDNATSAAPPGASVTLEGSLTEDNGLLVEITDSGNGMSADALATINARLASALDPPAPGQVGLFVVRELAARYGITVRLRQRGDGGGITATVLVPPELIGPELRTQAPELFNPASISLGWLGDGTSGPPRTAQEEWLEFFGSGPASELQPEFQPEFQPELQAEPASLAGIPEASGSPEVREEIYEMVSAWFREQRRAPVNDPPSVAQTDWRSPLDEGWRAAEALRGPIDHGLTAAGLPKRQPRAHLVSGVDSQVSRTPVPAAVVRTPDDVRSRLSRYQRGLRVGRHARVGPDERRSSEEDQR